MPTFITHSVVAGSCAYGFSAGKKSLKFWLLSIACSVLPDADVIGYRWLYIPYDHLFGHRGFFHSPFFAALLGILVVAAFYRKERIFSLRWYRYVLYFFLLTASHGLLDAMTNGGHGIAFLSPVSNNRYFLPWTPIAVSPLRINALLGPRGLTVVLSEMLWVWIPCLLIVFFLRIRRHYLKV
ncbi:MAG: metal-dependent hydrolase [Desulfobacterales bacterium]|nr:metal-dependent hydrolase [Desulfobacterales bacterium]